MNDRIIQTRTAVITFREDGIVQVRPVPGLDQNAEGARENLEACRQLAGGKKASILVDTRQMGVMDRQARNIYATEADFTLAQAMLVDSAFSRITANLFIRFAHPLYPTRMFTSEDEAIAWLKGFLR